MNFSIRFGFSEYEFTNLVQGTIFVIASVFLLLSVAKCTQTGHRVWLKWLVPMAIYTVDEAITTAILNVYTWFNSDEPEPLNTILDIMDDVALLAFLWALIVLWRIIRISPDLLKTPRLNSSETPEGVWPPAPKA